MMMNMMIIVPHIIPHHPLEYPDRDTDFYLLTSFVLSKSLAFHHLLLLILIIHLPHRRREVSHLGVFHQGGATK